MSGNGVKAELFRGIRSSIRNNGQAYGFSVSVTGAFAVLTGSEGEPGVLDVVLFGFGAAATFGLLETLATRGFRVPLEQESSVVTALGVSLSFASVALSVATAWAVSALLDGIPVWPLAGALTSGLYLLLAGTQLAIAEYARGRRDDG